MSMGLLKGGRAAASEEEPRSSDELRCEADELLDSVGEQKTVIVRSLF